MDKTNKFTTLTVLASLCILPTMDLLARGTIDGRTVHAMVESESGGSIKSRHRNSKDVYYVNAQQRVGAEILETARLQMERFLKTPIVHTNAVFSFSNPQIFGELSLYVIDDASMPMSLIAPEGRWAFVNVAKLAEGRGEKPAFLEARVKKEMARVGCLLLGGVGSSYRHNLLRFVASAEGLDEFTDDTLPVDGLQRCQQYLLQLGVKPWRTVSYRKACEEGWAPAPTNDVQKAIWDKVHAMPTEPIKIKPEEKRTEK